MALARAGVAEKADGERGLRLLMRGEVAQEVERGIVGKRGRLRPVGMKQGRGRVWQGSLLGGRHHLVHAFSPGGLPRRSLKGTPRITDQSMPTKWLRKLAS